MTLTEQYKKVKDEITQLFNMLEKTAIAMDENGHYRPDTRVVFDRASAVQSLLRNDFNYDNRANYKTPIEVGCEIADRYLGNKK